MPATKQDSVSINNWSGGLADSDVLGVQGSFVSAAGINIHSKPGLITPNQRLAVNSGATVVDFCQFGFYASDGNTYWFGNGGRIYSRTSGGTWTLQRTEAGNPAIIGAAEFNGYFYWATATTLHEMIITGNWTTDVDSVAGWPRTLNTATWHPMVVQGLYLCIGNGNQIATVDTSQVWTANGTSAVTLENVSTGLRIASLAKFGIDLIVGTYTINGDNNAFVNRWDLASPRYTAAEQIQESIVNCFWKFEDTLYAQCGTAGNIYYYDGKTLKKYKRIIGNYDNQTMTVNPGSTATFRGLPLFGVSNSSSNPCNEGVYSFGRYDKNYPIALNLEYVISGQATGHITNVQIGGIVAYANTLLVAWYDTTSGNNYGVDLIDWSNKYTAAFIKTNAITGTRSVDKYFNDFVVSYSSLPASTSIALSYFSNYSSSSTSITIATQSKANNIYYAQGNIEAGVMQFRLDFTVSANNAPTVDGMFFSWTEDNL